ncbi:MAG: hypothetical protein HPY83_18715, partial [Anaerolineae bacterium]|nr:hypothetical protein [Anaerolineae bacterium]
LNRLLARVTRAGDAARVHLSSGRLILVLAGYCPYWLWVGATFWALGRGLGAQPGSLFAWASAFSASYVAGYLSLLTPSGLGVREGVLALLLAGVAGHGMAGIAALGGRLWLSLAELLMASLAGIADPALIWIREPGRRP